MLNKEITGKVLNAAFEVHSTLGPGFLEAVYEEALAREFSLQAISFARQKLIEVFYKGATVKNYVADFVVADSVIVELKAIRSLTQVEVAQTINYLKASGYQTALLLNFGAMSLQFKRLVYTPSEKSVKSV